MKKVLAVLIWCAALVAALMIADRITMRPDSDLKYRNFLNTDEKKEPFDVFLMGTSHVFDGVFPPQLYRDYGIVSYNLGNSSELLEFTEWTLRLALQYHKPRMVVLDTFYVNRSLEDVWAYSYRHLFMDAMPLNLLKIQSVTSTMAQSYWSEFLFPFSLYHGRWEEMIAGTTQLTMDSVPCMMGAEMRLDRVPVPEPYVRYQGMNEKNMSGKDAIRRIAAICREQGIELVLTAIPSPATEQEQKDINSVVLLAEELNVPFINMFDVPGLVDMDNDLYDGFSHLNPDGAVKVTRYLGNWLRENTDLPDRRGEAAYANWENIVREFEDYFRDHWQAQSLLTGEDVLIK